MHLVSQYSKYILAGDPLVSPLLLEELARSPHPAVRARVAENPATSLAILLYLTRDNSDDVRVALTNNQNELPLSVLVSDRSADVRFALAENLHAPRELIKVLTRDDNPYVANRASRTLSMQIENGIDAAASDVTAA